MDSNSVFNENLKDQVDDELQSLNYQDETEEATEEEVKPEESGETTEDKSLDESESEEVAAFLTEATDEELLAAIRGMQSSMGDMARENDMLCHFAKDMKVDSELPKSWKKKSATSSDLTLTVAQMCHVSNKRVEELKIEITAIERKSEYAREMMKAKEIELELEEKEKKEDIVKFNDEIRFGAKHPVSHKIMAEKVDKFFNDLLKKYAIKQERTKMQMLENRKNRKRIVRKTKEKIEASQLLRQVDIDRTKQEHNESLALTAHYEKLYYENRGRLNRLLQDIAEKKKALTKETKEYRTLLRTVKQKERTKEVFEKEKQIIEHEREQCEILKEKIKLNPQYRGMPLIMDYVHLEANLEDLTKQVKYWRSKVEALKLAKYCKEGKKKNNPILTL